MFNYYYVSYLFIDKFIRDHKLKAYDSNMVKELYIYSSSVRLYLDHVYLYIYQYDGEYILVIETFIKNFKLYALKWFGDWKDFIKVVNDLNLTPNIGRGGNYRHRIDESKILEAVLESILNRREYIISKYDLR